MSKVAGSLPCTLISFRHLGSKSSAHNLLKEQESKNPQNVAENDEANNVEAGETSTSPAKGSSSLQGAPMRAESIRVSLVVEDRDLTMAEKDFVRSSCDVDVGDLNAFVTERLHFLSGGSAEKFDWS